MMRGKLLPGQSKNERYPTRELSEVLTAVKSGVKFLTEGESMRDFRYSSACFYYFFDNYLENSNLDDVLQGISILNTHVHSGQKKSLAGRQQAWLRRNSVGIGQGAGQRARRGHVGPDRRVANRL
ncbi:hypothetical protein [Xanthomonas fragariae]|uniref:hypothetical protein n=1 Tax=Xanthomonas fragariae TaxID=48664 RepID=UPI0012F7144E|nr:hypothetical protein [Xanthomonas fragariae]MDM7553738.1 hypothetical protein [Xanthomonas fragariae]MDM7556888.1 hypothetical protein [Xanthomonas fragariae]MDM7571480.1 hypothetical protein [Xanthomonas fragariae]MDM7574572.1 hypothetical protein [Xanthomonas fragariae]MDM7577705.1 hypothetical protein [Xanthomonas fragariae]